MKFFTNQRIWKKIVIALLVVLLFNALIVKPVQADALEFGGKLMSPILSLLVSLGDGILDVIGRTIMGGNTTLYKVERGSGFWDTVKTWIVAIGAAVIAIVAIVATMGLAAVALAVVGITATVTVGIGTVIAAGTAAAIAAVWYSDEMLPDDLYLPLYTYSAEEIFKGNILLFDVNFFEEGKEIWVKCQNGTELSTKNFYDKASGETLINNNGGALYYYYIDGGKEVKTSNQSSAAMLKQTVSSWYNALRSICLVLMLSVLVYIGIRMLLSSVAADKAKYLTMLKDWFIGLCLLFLMHYIMAFSVTLVEKLTEIVKTSVDGNAYMVTMQADDKIQEAVKEDLQQPETLQEKDGTTYLNWPTNLMGSLRLQVQMQSYGGQYIGLCLCFVMLCLFTLYFTITYLKRVLYMAFLTLIAPMVALTYCIDKINDGQAQGFNKWFREYVFNLLIQPMHLLLYYILISSAFELASTNVIYSIVAIGFMIPAEKLLRSLFGFEKAQTAQSMGTAGAMMASTALNHLLHKGPRGKGEGNDGSLDGSDSDSERVPNPIEPNPIQAFLNNGSSDNGEGDEGSAQQRMLDAYDEQEGNEWNPEEREAMARETNNNQGNMNYSDEEYANIMRQSGWTEDEIQQMTAGENSQTQGANQNNPYGYSDDEIRQMMNNDYLQQGMGNSGTGEIGNQLNQNGRINKTGGKIGKAVKGVPRRIKRMAHASWAAQKASMRNAPRRFKRKLENSHPIRMVGRLAGGAAVGALAGAAGLAIAATTGDIDNVPKIAGAAAATGYAVGSGRARSIKSPMQDQVVKEVRDNSYNKGKNGEFKPDAMKDYIKDFKKNPKNRNYFEEAFGDDAKDMLKNGGEIDQYLNNDITDIKEMKAMHKLQKEGIVRNVDQAIAVSQLGAMIGSDTNNMTQKRRNEWKARIGEMAGSNVQESDREQFAEDRLKEIDKLHDFRK